MSPRIGTPIRLEDGTIDIGPISYIGGPSDTASDFYRAWAALAEFQMPEERRRRPAVLTHDEILDCTRKFPARQSELADVIAGPYNEGPFPLVHVDYGHNNIILDAEYNMLGVIDWEYAIVTPWGMVEFPLAVSALPVAVDAPWNYNPDGSPKAADGIAQHKDREGYLQAVRDAESELGIPPKLSEVSRNEKVRDVTAAMKLFSVDGKPGFFSRVLDAFDGAEDS